MKRMQCAVAALWIAWFAPAGATVIEPFFSEVHYDNAGRDAGEFVAVTVPAGFGLDGWGIALYNGSTGGVYASKVFTGTGPATSWREIAWFRTGIQNDVEAMALVSPGGRVVEFLAYEGTVAALEGPAAGQSARVMPVSQSGSTAVGQSLQRTGRLDAWSWLSGPASPGQINPALALPASVAVTDTLWLVVAGAVAGAVGNRRHRSVRG